MSTWKPKRGVTLIELLVVISIIVILSALLIPAILVVKKKARRNSAVAEVMAIDVACRNYLADYRKAPVMMPFNPDPEIIQISIEGEFARVLKGLNDANNNNAKNLPYIEFKRFDDGGDPVNPWGGRFYVKFDTDYNGTITAGAGEPGDPPDDSLDRSIIVWTHNLDVEPGDDLYLLTSWKSL